MLRVIKGLQIILFRDRAGQVGLPYFYSFLEKQKFLDLTGFWNLSGLIFEKIS